MTRKKWENSTILPLMLAFYKPKMNNWEKNKIVNNPKLSVLI
jgi:hypothetical protein